MTPGTVKAQAPAAPLPVVDDGRSALLDSIRKGTTLKVSRAAILHVISEKHCKLRLIICAPARFRGRGYETFAFYAECREFNSQPRNPVEPFEQSAATRGYQLGC